MSLWGGEGFHSRVPIRDINAILLYTTIKWTTVLSPA